LIVGPDRDGQDDKRPQKCTLEPATAAMATSRRRHIATSVASDAASLGCSRQAIFKGLLYAADEEWTIKRLTGKYATREAEVDELLRQGVLVDLSRVVLQGFVIGARSYSLKHLGARNGRCGGSPSTGTTT
jgi:hypothetical protein